MLTGLMGGGKTGFIWHPCLSVVVTAGQRMGDIFLWHLDLARLLQVASSSETVYYTKAKAVLVDESGVDEQAASSKETFDKTLYVLDNNARTIQARPILSMSEALPFDEDGFYRIYFNEGDNDDLPHAEFFGGIPFVRLNFVEDIRDPRTYEMMEQYMQSRKFMTDAQKRWGGIEVLWGGPGDKGNNKALPAHLTIYYDEKTGLAFAYLELDLVNPRTYTYDQLLEDYQFIRHAYEVAQRETKGFSQDPNEPQRLK